MGDQKRQAVVFSAAVCSLHGDSGVIELVLGSDDGPERRKRAEVSLRSQSQPPKRRPVGGGKLPTG